MAKINLLPWRDERREELKKEFLSVLAAVALVAGVLIFLSGYFMSTKVSHQGERNAYLKTSIDDLTKQVSEISELEERKESLLDRMKVIQDLQGNRPVIVRVFDELVRTVPDGTYYVMLDRKGNKVTVSGIAESSNRVSSLMRGLDGSDWFKNPNLSNVKANPILGEQSSEFELTVNIDTPITVNEKEGG